MRVIRYFGYFAAMISFALLIMDGAHSLVLGAVAMMSIAETWELIGPYLANLLSAGKGSGLGSSLVQSTLADQLQIPASLAMLGVTGVFFLLDFAVRRCIAAVQHAIRQIVLVAS